MVNIDVCGIDEAGRGPIAGPVTAAAVVLSADFPVELLNDSKALPPSKRTELCALIMNSNSAWGVGWATSPEIDRLNIHFATLLAMKRAFINAEHQFPEELSKVTLCQVDGKFSPELPVPSEAVIKGDSKIHQIMAASIVAKTVRDRYMERLDWIDDRWNFTAHKGYPTKAHRANCKLHGISPYHRISFRIFSSDG